MKRLKLEIGSRWDLAFEGQSASCIAVVDRDSGAKVARFNVDDFAKKSDCAALAVAVTLVPIIRDVIWSPTVEIVRSPASPSEWMHSKEPGDVILGLRWLLRSHESLERSIALKLRKPN